MKNELRKKYKLIRNNIKNRKNKNKKIEEKVIKIIEKNQAKIVAFYKSFSTEVPTDIIIEHIIQNGKIVVLPKVDKNGLNFYKIKSLKNNLKKNRYGIEEPISQEENYTEPDLIDIVIVPGLSFDKGKNRLGFGGGYYDKFLSNINSLKIGICYEEQIYESILPTDQTDIKMDVIITDKNIY